MEPKEIAEDWVRGIGAGNFPSKKQKLAQAYLSQEKKIEGLVELLELAKCPDCDGSGCYPSPPHGDPTQCRWCFEKDLALTAYKEEK